MPIRVILACLLFVQFVSAVNIIYDETGWTKLDWHKYKLDYSTVYDPIPSLEIIKSPEIRKALAQCSLNSLDGPYQRKAQKRPPGLWSLEDGSLVQAPEEDSVDAAAEAMTCTICHGLVSHVWHQVVTAIHNAEPINEAAVGDMFEEACEIQHVPTKVLQKYRIVKVEAPEAGVSLFVVRMRPGSHPTSLKSAEDTAAGTNTHPGTEAEVAAAHKSCRDLANHHHSTLVKPIWKHANDYFLAYRNLGRRLLSKFELDAADTDEYEEPDTDDEDTRLEHKALEHIPEHKLMPWEELCLDLDMLCPMWASLGECEANPKYMLGNSQKVGHCRKSCGTCKADESWKDHPIATKELAATASTLLNMLRNAACTSSQACMSGGAGSSTPGASAAPVKTSAVYQNAAVLPGAALAQREGFVLGKPFWAVPEVLPNPKGGGASGDVGDPADELLVSEGLGSQFVQIPGMDGFFVYQLHYKYRVYQFHLDTSTGKVTEDHVLGYYDRAATEAAAARDRASEEAGRVLSQTAWHAQQKALAAEAAAAATAATGQKDSSSGSSASGAKRSAGLDGQQETLDTAAAATAAGEGEGSEAAHQGDESTEPGWKPSRTAVDPSAGQKAAAAAGSDTASLKSTATANKAVAGQKVTSSASSDKWSKHAPPMLEMLDYLPDTISMIDSYWPYFRQMYTGGEACGAEGKGQPRSVELRVACSPHKTMQLLIREPEFCRYVAVLYHPSLCQLARYKPVPKGSLGQSAAAAAAAARKQDGSGGSGSRGVSSTDKQEHSSKEGRDKKSKSTKLS